MTGSYARRAVGRASIVAWVLFGLTAAVLAITSVVLARRYSDASTRLNTEVAARADVMARLAKKESEVSDANARAQKAEDELKSVTAERDALALKLKAAEDKLAKASATPPTPPPPTKKTGKTKKVKKRHR